ncbi:hypothetical protein M9Y10_041096 [Tritrichomonas musculus]|uniref:Uncharacterized protein n=1 Tax=Tritrichomonas musculus TaxID=1915356 RepID=A0ABR2K3E4_9EUKA
MNHPYPIHYQSYQQPQPYDDLPDLVLYTTFNANEIIDLLKIVLDKNLNSKSTQDRILQEIINELIKTSWNEKLNNFLKNITISVQTAIQNQSSQMDTSPFDEINDIIAYLQILGGLDPESAIKAGIKHDFIKSFNFMMMMIQKLFQKKWPECPQNSPIFKQLNLEKQKMFILCFKTITELLNRNLPYFDSPEALIRCFISVVDYVDQSGSFANYFTPSLRILYDRLQIELFKTNLRAYQLPAVAKSAIRLNVDISDTIELLPNNSRKFNCVYHITTKIDQEDPLFQKYRNCLIHCVQKSNDVDVITQGMKSFSKDPECKNHFFNKLSELLSVWINELLSRRSINHEAVKAAYKPLRKIMSILSENDKHKLFSKVKETELCQALSSLVKRDLKELNTNDPMAQDIKAIISE